MTLLREIVNTAHHQKSRTGKYTDTRWLTHAEGQALLEEMRGMRMVLPMPSYLGVVEKSLPPPESVDGAVIHTSAGPVTIRVGVAPEPGHRCLPFWGVQ